MKTTTIGNLTILRPTEEEYRERGEELRDQCREGTDGLLWGLGPHYSDEEILARVECTKIIDDERSSQVAKETRVVVVHPGNFAPRDRIGNPLVLPPEACVARRTRSIRARQAAINAGVAPPSTPLVGAPIPVRT
jgi:hypothetical protein